MSNSGPKPRSTTPTRPLAPRTLSCSQVRYLCNRSPTASRRRTRTICSGRTCYHLRIRALLLQRHTRGILARTLGARRSPSHPSHSSSNSYHRERSQRGITPAQTTNSTCRCFPAIRTAQSCCKSSNTSTSNRQRICSLVL